MNTDVLNKIKQSKAKVVIFDIDGTLKDLCTEHSMALQITLDEYNVGRVRQDIILALNDIAMVMIKTGFFPTNHAKQNLLVWMFAVLSGKNIKAFQKEYFKNYTHQLCLFNGVYQLLNFLKSRVLVYFSTVNRQNYNLEDCGITQDRIMYTLGKSKKATYKKLLDNLKVDKKEIIIVGDNIFDDLLSAKALGVKCLLINNYNSRLKGIICKVVNDKQLE